LRRLADQREETALARLEPPGSFDGETLGGVADRHERLCQIVPDQAKRLLAHAIPLLEIRGQRLERQRQAAQLVAAGNRNRLVETTPFEGHARFDEPSEPTRDPPCDPRRRDERQQAGEAPDRQGGVPGALRDRRRGLVGARGRRRQTANEAVEGAVGAGACSRRSTALRDRERTELRAAVGLDRRDRAVSVDRSLGLRALLALPAGLERGAERLETIDETSCAGVPCPDVANIVQDAPADVEPSQRLERFSRIVGLADRGTDAGERAATLFVRAVDSVQARRCRPDEQYDREADAQDDLGDEGHRPVQATRVPGLDAPSDGAREERSG